MLNTRTEHEVGRRRASVVQLFAVFVLALAISGCVRTESDGSDLGNTTASGNTGGGTGGGSGGGSGGGAGGGSPPPPPPDDETPPPIDPDPPIDPPPTTDVATFEQFLHPVLADANNFCVGCHGVAQIPTFAVADVMSAYNTIISQQKVNLDNPSMSRLYLRPAVDRHNCGGDAICDMIAAEILAGIEGWAANRPPPDPTQQTVISATTTFADGALAGLVRVENNIVAKFTFEEGVGDVTVDTSGVGAPITLQLQGTEWVEGGLRNVSGSAIASVEDSRKLFDTITATNEFTVEAWVIPDNTAQDGPARIVSYSQDTGMRNFTMGQNAIYYQLRNRSLATGVNGTPELEALSPETSTSLQHVVMTFDSTGRKIYIDGALSIEEALQDDTLDWLDDQRLVLGNEVTNDRLWQGVFDLVAIHNRALTAVEVQQNFAAGSGDVLSLRFELDAILGAPAYIEMQAAQLDPFSYVFGKPVYVGDPTGIQIKNVRIAVNDSVPVAAQAFRRIDTTVMQSGVELSPLGAVIPAALGPDSDVFHLEFETLGGRLGQAEPIAPPSPPPLPPDLPEPDLGLRTFSQVNDTMAVLTGIDANDGTVAARYAELRDSLPPTADLLAFGAAQQIAIQQLATTYCGQVVANGAMCSNFFGTSSCDVAVGEKSLIADALYDKLIGDNLANQPARAQVTTEIVSVLDDLGCANGCNGVTAETALNATCAAVLSSGAVIVN